MRILMLSSDPNILVDGNEAQNRMKEYANVLGELHIVAAVKNTRLNTRLRSSIKSSIGSSIFTYAASGRNIFVRLFRMYRICCHLFKKNHFDILTVQAPDEIGLIGFLAARKFKIPLQVQIHTDVFSPWYRKASWKEYFRYLLANFLLPKASCIRVVSERIKKTLDLRFRTRALRIFILPIFTEITKFLSASSNPEIESRFKEYIFKMIAVGRLVEKEKNFKMLIETMKDFIKICPQSLLVLVGEGPDKEDLKLKIKDLGLENNVILETARYDLESFYKSFDLFLLSSNYEGWGRVVIEAMASGLPVVMTDVGLAGEIVKNKENGIIVPVQDKNAFLKACKYMYENPEERKRMANAALITVQNLRPLTKKEYLNNYVESFQSCSSSLVNNVSFLSF